VGGASRGDYVQDERYIAKSTWMCGAIVHGLHNPKAIATGCADPSYKCTTLWEARLAAYYSTQRALASIEQLTTGKELTAKFDRCHAPTDWERKINVSSLTGQSHD